MVDNAYIYGDPEVANSGRKKFQRPQGMLWAENPGRLQDGKYLPNGYEINTAFEEPVDSSLLNQFMILSDHNRGPIDFDTERIERRERMINGRMRSYHIADKLTISTAWDMLPSRAFSKTPNFNPVTGIADLNSVSSRATGPDLTYDIPNLVLESEQYTLDGGAGGVELLDWYENHTGSFWVYLSYDKYTNFEDEDPYGHLQEYNQVLEMFISEFTYSIDKRGGSNFDFWNVSVTLEEA